MRPAASALGVLAVELGDAGAEGGRVAADLVERDEPVIAVEGGVLHPLGHDRSGQLLELHDEPAALVPLLLAQGAIVPILPLQQEHVSQEIENGRVGGRVAPLGQRHRPHDRAPVAIETETGHADGRGTPSRSTEVGGEGFAGDVGAIDREGGDHLAQGVAQGAQGEVARPSILLRDAVQRPRQDVGLAGQRGAQHQPLGFIGRRGEGTPPALTGDAGVEIVEGTLVRRIDEETGRDARKLVADGAVHRPVVRQRLPRLQDLLHDHVERKALGQREPVIRLARPLVRQGGIDRRPNRCAPASDLRLSVEPSCRLAVSTARAPSLSQAARCRSRK